MTKNRNIIIVSPSLKMGGVERAGVNIANTFAAQGKDVVFVALFQQEQFFHLLPTIQFYEPKGFNKIKLSLVKSVLWLRKTIKQNNPETILVFNYFYGAIVQLAVIGLKIPVFVSDRGSPFYKWPKHVKLFNDVVFSLFPPKGIVAQTQIAADLKASFYKKRTKIRVIPNALREVQLYPEIQRQKQILAVGRLGDQLKGFDRLIDAFALLKNQDWELIIAGGDEDGEYLKKQASKLNIFARIQFLGKVKDIDRIYAQAGIFVIPSRSEGFPNGLCEAMAAGLPCISYDFIAGPRDIITDGQNGIIIENGKIDALAAAIDHLIENPSEREKLSINSMNIRERLKLEKIGKEYLDFILNDNDG